MDRRRRRPERSRAAVRFDEITPADFAVPLFAVVAAVFTIGVATPEDRLGCGLNDIVGAVLACPTECR